MIRKTLAALACATMLATGAHAQTAAPIQPDVALMRDAVKTLASDAFEGRAPATAAEPKVLDYIIGKFRAVGLQPGVHGG